MKKYVFLGLGLLILIFQLEAREGQEGKIKVKNDPVLVGERVAENVINRRFGWRYQRACAYYEQLIFSEQQIIRLFFRR
jgi:hypothetical protein